MIQESHAQVVEDLEAFVKRIGDRFLPAVVPDAAAGLLLGHPLSAAFPDPVHQFPEVILQRGASLSGLEP